MNNIEERIENLKANIALSELIGPDELKVSVSDLAALIAQLEAAQKERDGLREKVNQADTEWQKMADRILAVGKRAETAEAALSAANEKLSKPVVLPRMHVGFDGVSTNAGDSVRNKTISDCAEAIRLTGFTVDEGQDLWLT
ncbi:TPA: hypothetical protein ACJHE1_004426 [Yersinia enterocolitica]